MYKIYKFIKSKNSIKKVRPITQISRKPYKYSLKVVPSSNLHLQISKKSGLSYNRYLVINNKLSRIDKNYLHKSL